MKRFPVIWPLPPTLKFYFIIIPAIILIQTRFISAGDLIWPIDCIPGGACHESIGYPDINGDGKAFNCQAPGYTGHQGTDIGINWDHMDAGVSVFAAADGVVLWVFDGKYDRCPDPSNPDCAAPPPDWFVPGQSNGYRVCTESGNYCGAGECCCFWCFDGGNVVVIRHANIPGVFATRYDHLKRNSIMVSPGTVVTQGQKIAEVGSSGNSAGPHLHFEVWGTGFYELADPWAGPCGPNYNNSLWKNNPPYACVYKILPTSQTFSSAGGTGNFSMAAMNDCNWTATSNAGWIAITSGSSGSGNGTVSFSVQSNDAGTGRTGLITAGGNHFTVTQSGVPCTTVAPAAWINILLLD